METKNQPQVEDLFTSKINLILPTICIYEVYKVLNRSLGDKIAESAILFMQKYAETCEIDEDFALTAAQINSERKLPMADSLIYATTLKNEATLWTQVSYFKGLPSVNYFEK